MIYVIGVLIPLVLQVTLVLIINVMNTGNGSWVGLGAFLIGVVTIPVTAIVNLIWAKAHKEKRGIAVAGRCFTNAAVVPLLFMALTFLGLLLE